MKLNQNTKLNGDRSIPFGLTHLFSLLSAHLVVGALLLFLTSGCSSDPYRDMDIDKVVELESEYLKKRQKKVNNKANKEGMKGIDRIHVRRSDIPWK